MPAPGDKEALRQLAAMCRVMSREELERFCEGTMNTLVVGQHFFRQRFPEAWQVFNDKIEAGLSGFAVTEL